MAITEIRKFGNYWRCDFKLVKYDLSKWAHLKFSHVYNGLFIKITGFKLSENCLNTSFQPHVLPSQPYNRYYMTQVLTTFSELHCNKRPIIQFEIHRKIDKLRFIKHFI